MNLGCYPTHALPTPEASSLQGVSRSSSSCGQDKGLALRREAGPEVQQARAQIDPGTLNNILQNLVSNAVKFTSEGHVTVTTFLSKDGLSTENAQGISSGRLRIEDTGSGIDPEVAARILVVEDNQDTRQLIEIILSEANEVCATGTVREAIEQARDAAFDLAFVDINLGTPEGGLEVLRQLRAWPAYEGVPIVAMTAYAMPSDRERFLSEGFDAYLSKPFTSNELLDMTAAQLSR